MKPSRPTFDSVFPPWRSICDRYDSICNNIHQRYPSSERAWEKEESIHWEQTAFELILMLLLQLDFSFKASADSVQKLIKSTDEVDKEIDFSIHLFEKEIYFGVTSFSDSLKDFSKDTNNTSIEIKNLRYSNGLTSPIARITSIRSHHEYMNRRLAVRIAKEGKHKLDSDYIYVVFPKSAH